MKVISNEIKGKTILLRVDFNVPVVDGIITDYTRIDACKPTIDLLLENDNTILLLSHLGRPKGIEEKCSLRILLPYLEKIFAQKVQFETDYLDGFTPTTKLVLLENIRFDSGEEQNDPILSQKLANLADVIVIDAFATAHRKSSSTYGSLLLAHEVYAGLLLASEVEALSKAMQNPARPLVAIVGGSKVSTKLPIIENLLKVVDKLIVGGGIANTFLSALGYNIGKSLYEPDLIDTCKKLLESGKIILPKDAMVSKEFADKAGRVSRLDDISSDEMILDIGSETTKSYEPIINTAKTILVNGPVGVFEFSNFASGTKALFELIGNSSAYRIGGGGDTISAIESFGMKENFDYISTAGGAFLEYVEGKILPTLEALEKRDDKKS